MTELDFTLKRYRQLLETILEKNYSLTTLSRFIEKPQEKAVILRHDVDRKPENALKMAAIEKSLDVSADYYFRVVKESWDEEIIREIHRTGHEIGYHYEDLAMANGGYEKAYVNFKLNLEKLRKLAPVKTMCMHGSPLSRWDNRLLWKKYNYKESNILAEPYFDLDFNKVMYLTDASRRWDGKNVTVRDKVDSHFKYSFKSTLDIVKAFEIECMPSHLMINIHPHNWSSNQKEWVTTIAFQSIKNTIKRLVVMGGK
jgi:hypothetical protein